MQKSLFFFNFLLWQPKIAFLNVNLLNFSIILCISQKRFPKIFYRVVRSFFDFIYFLRQTHNHMLFLFCRWRLFFNFRTDLLMFTIFVFIFNRFSNVQPQASFEKKKLIRKNLAQNNSDMQNFRCLQVKTLAKIVKIRNNLQKLVVFFPSNHSKKLFFYDIYAKILLDKSIYR